NVPENVAVSTTHSVLSSSELVSSVMPERTQVTLEEILERTFPEKRERAVHTYWRYVTFQKQMYVLAYQQEILNSVSKRVLADSLNSESSPIMGMSLELQFLILRAELLKVQALGWEERCRLAGYLSEELTWPVNFPVAETEMKSEAFQIGLDRYAPGSVQDMKTLPLARHLYFCAGQLATTTESVRLLADYIVVPSEDGDFQNSALFQRLKSCPYSELETIFGMLECARNASFRYFQLLYSMNSTYSSCVLVGGHASDSALELAEILSR
ncbi:MAG: hypothetical protein Q4C70_13175, partial [Planctomycetia bacterium]|nr:hypothetical protein [Planctomycetia bacterium]